MHSIVSSIKKERPSVLPDDRYFETFDNSHIPTVIKPLISAAAKNLEHCEE